MNNLKFPQQTREAVFVGKEEEASNLNNTRGRSCLMNGKWPEHGRWRDENFPSWGDLPNYYSSSFLIN